MLPSGGRLQAVALLASHQGLLRIRHDGERIIQIFESIGAVSRNCGESAIQSLPVPSPNGVGSKIPNGLRNVTDHGSIATASIVGPMTINRKRNGEQRIQKKRVSKVAWRDSAGLLSFVRQTEHSARPMYWLSWFCNVACAMVAAATFVTNSRLTTLSHYLVAGPTGRQICNYCVSRAT